VLPGFWLQAALARLAGHYFAEGGPPPFRPLARAALVRTLDVSGAAGLTLLPVSLLPLLALLLVRPHTAAAALGVGALAALAAAGLAVGLILVLPAAAHEPLGPVAAVARGWRLARGRRLALLGNLAALFLLAVATLAAANLAVGLVAALLAKVAPVAAVLATVVAFLALVALGLLFAAGFSVLAALFYYEARVTQEGWRPPWRRGPHGRWPLDRPRLEPELAQRGRRAVRDFLVVNAAFGLLLGLALTAATRQAAGLLAALPAAALQGQPAAAPGGGAAALAALGAAGAGAAPGTAGGGTALPGAASPETGGDLSRAAYADFQAGRYRQAIARLDRVIAADPEDAWAWYTRGWAHWRLGERQAANADAARACDLGYEAACALIGRTARR
ncbi:MAG: tetratricopeptide repeat protein, partial [Nitrospirae bacterium]